MGYLTTITIHNDAFHEFRKFPKLFGESVLDAVVTSQRKAPKATGVSFKNYSNYIYVHPSRHADDEHIMVHKGNMVVTSGEIHSWIDEGRTNLAREFIDAAERDVEFLKERLKKKLGKVN